MENNEKSEKLDFAYRTDSSSNGGCEHSQPVFGFAQNVGVLIYL